MYALHFATRREPPSGIHHHHSRKLRLSLWPLLNQREFRRHLDVHHALQQLIDLFRVGRLPCLQRRSQRDARIALFHLQLTSLLRKEGARFVLER